MANTLIITFVFAIAAVGALALQQQITIYELPDQQGDSHTFTGKYADLSNWTSFLSKAQSYCMTGRFYFWDLKNFIFNDSLRNSGDEVDVTECNNFTTFGMYKSGRIQGPADFYAPVLSLYEGYGGYWNAGREIVVTTAASNNFPFLPASIISFGNASWTIFPENNFGGTSWCFEGGNDALGYRQWTTNSSFPVQSVIKGCNHADVEYYRNLHA